MLLKKMVFTIVLTLAIASFPGASQSEVVTSRWNQSAVINDDGTVSMDLQAEIQNSAGFILDGFRIVVPASKVTPSSDFNTTDFGGTLTVETKPVAGGTELTVYFNRKPATGQTWNGRVHYEAEGWAKKEGEKLVLQVDLSPPVVFNQSNSMTAKFADGSRGINIALPRAYEFSYKSVPSWKTAFQYSRIKAIWIDTGLAGNNSLKVEAVYSELLGRIVAMQDAIAMTERKAADMEKTGVDVSEARQLVIGAKKNLTDATYWYERGSANRDKAEAALQSAQSALSQAEAALAKSTPLATSTPTATLAKSPSPGVWVAVIALLAVCMVKKRVM